MKEKAKKIRAEIKKLGFTSKEISVRVNGSVVWITIKTVEAKKNIKAIEKIAKSFESISWDQRTGGILDGADNEYVFVKSDI